MSSGIRGICDLPAFAVALDTADYIDKRQRDKSDRVVAQMVWFFAV